MGILFDNDGELINHGSGATLDALTSFTAAAWFYPTTIDTAGRSVLSKWDSSETAGWIMTITDRWDGGTPDSLYFWRVGSTWQHARSPNSMIVLNTWNFAAVYCPTIGTAPSLYHATYPNLVGNVTEAATQTGASLADDSAFDCIAGAVDGSSTNKFRGTLGYYAVWNGQVTLTQLQKVQYKLLNTQAVGDCRLFCIPGLNGASSVTDYSGNSNNGTVTNATLSTVHLSQGPVFGSNVDLPYEVTAGGLSVPVGVHHNKTMRAA